MPRFVLLRHECPPPSKKSKHEKPSHWDFMLESDGVLRTWELRELPAAWAALLDQTTGETAGETAGGASVTATPLPDHRLAYLDYEGPISGGRGSVCCCDRGTYELLQETPKQKTPKGRTLQQAIYLSGRKLSGAVRLTGEGKSWTLTPVDV